MALRERSRGGVKELRLEGKIERPSPVKLRVDGRLVDAFEGESVAAALLASDVLHLRSSPRRKAPTGMFCAMGVCQECVVEVDGRRMPACVTPVRDGMTIRLGR